MEFILTTNEELSKVVTEAVNRAVEIALSNQKEPKEDLDKWMNLPELMEYLPDHPAAATIYSWVSSRKIPHHKGAKALRFLKSEIDQWLASGKRKSESELQTEAEQYRLRKGGVSRHD